MGNFLAIEKSTCVNPKPRMSFLPSVPCRGVEGIEKALMFKIFPPGAVGLATHTGCPGTRSGLAYAKPSGSGEEAYTTALNGKPVRATTTASSDQSLLRTDRNPDLDVDGIE